MKRISAIVLLFLSLYSHGQLVPPTKDHEFLTYPFQVKIIPLNIETDDFLHLFKGTKKHGDILYRNKGDSLIRVILPQEMKGKKITYHSKTDSTVFFYIKNNTKDLYGYNIKTGMFMLKPKSRGHDGEDDL